MATQTTVMLVDDVDGGEADETIEFGLDGVTYEIDLSSPNAQSLRAAMAAYVESGRRTGGRKQSNTPKADAKAMAAKPEIRRTVLPEVRRPWTPAERHAMQRFAEKTGRKPPAERGRIARDVVQAWMDAGKPMK